MSKWDNEARKHPMTIPHNLTNETDNDDDGTEDHESVLPSFNFVQILKRYQESFSLNLMKTV